MRILVLEDNASSTAGGAEKSMRAVCAHLSVHHDVHLAFAAEGDYVADPDLARIYAGTLHLPMKALLVSAPLDFGRDVMALRSYVARHGIERIITHMVHVAPMLRLLKHVTGTPFGIYYKWIGSMEDAGAKIRWGNAGVAGAASVSQFVANYWLKNGIPEDAIRVVPEGCVFRDDVVNAYPERPAPVIGFAGRLLAMKGLDDLIKALPLIRSAVPGTTLRIAGNYNTNTNDPLAGAAYKDHVEGLIAELGIGDAVHFDGFVSPLEPWLAELDVSVIPSVVPDAQPLVMMQSMAVGTPVVATRVGGIPEVLSGPFDDLLAPSSAPEALATRIVALLKDSDARRRIGTGLRLRVRERYTMDRHFADLSDALGITRLSPRRRSPAPANSQTDP